MIKKLLYTLCSIFFLGNIATAQSTLTIGSGGFTTTSNAYGIMRTITTSNSWNRNAYIYPTSLVNTIPTNSTITSLDFYASNASAASLPAGSNFKLYIKNTISSDFGAASLDWTTEIATATLVYDGDPATIIGSASGFKQFPFSSGFVYTGNGIEILVEFTLTTAPSANILWTYDNSGGVPGYTANQGKYINGTGTPTAILSNSNERHPNMKVNYSPNIFANDMTVTAFVAPASPLLTNGSPSTITVTVKNNGSATQNAVPVYYSVDGGTPAGPIFTGSLAQNATENITLPSYTSTSGYHTIKAFSALLGEQSFPNDTLSITVLGGPISTYPFIETFSTALGWSANANIWSIGLVTTQANGLGGRAASANFFNIATTAAADTLRSPTLNFSGLTKPILSYSFSHPTYTAATPEPDSLKVIISTNGGTTWGTPIFTKSANGSPSLNTIAASNIQYNPQAKGDWRHEMIDLSAYANQANVKIGFIAISGFGNQLVIDNILLSDASIYTEQPVTSTGVQSAVGGATINFTSIIPNGKLKIAKYLGAPTSSAATIIATNATATTDDASVFTPTLVSNDFWYTITYDSVRTYSISIDISTLSNAPLKSKLYIVKRASQNDSWQAVNTTLSGNSLTASGLTSFSDFAIAGDASNPSLPLEIVSFQGQLRNSTATLTWSTIAEVNTSKFVVERNNNNSWSSIATVDAKGEKNNTYQITDANLAIGKYQYRLKMMDKDGKFTYSSIVLLEVSSKNLFVLNQNYPNPVKGSTALSYQLSEKGKVSIELFTQDGRKVASIINAQQSAGTYNVSIDVKKYALATGNYNYRMVVVNNNNQEVFRATKTMVIAQ